MSEQDYPFTGVRADDVQTEVEQSDKYQFHTGNATYVCTICLDLRYLFIEVNYCNGT